MSDAIGLARELLKGSSIGLIASFLTMVGATDAAVSSFSISSYPGITKWNALGLAVDGDSENVFVTSLSYGGENNLYKFSPSGSLVYSKRLNFGSPGDFSLINAVAADSDNVYIGVLRQGAQDVVRLNGNGVVLSSFSISPTLQGLGYIPSSNTFMAFDYSDRSNPAIVEFGANGSTSRSTRVNDPYLSTIGGFTEGAAYDPISQTIFTSYLNQTGLSQFNHNLAEYKLGNDGEYYVANLYDLASVGITGTVLAMDINRTSSVFFVQENNSRIVTFALSDLTPLSEADPPVLVNAVPEPSVCNLILVGLVGLVGFTANRKRAHSILSATTNRTSS